MIKKLKLFALIFCFFCSNTFAEKNVNSIAAVVNNGVITQAELNHQIANIKKQLSTNHVQIPPENVLKTQLLQQLIDRKLQLQKAEEAGVTISPEETTKAINRMAKQSHLSVSAFYSMLEQQGYTLPAFKKEITNELLIQKIQGAAISPQIKVSDEEIDDALRNMKKGGNGTAEYHLEDILISLPDSPSTEQVDAARTKAKAIIAQLNHGANFSELAQEDSSAENALEGGDLGWRKPEELPTPFVRPVQKLTTGQIAGPIRAPNGFHVIKLEGVRNATGLAGNKKAQRDQVANMIFQRKFQQALENWIAQLRAEAYIKKYNGN